MYNYYSPTWTPPTSCPSQGSTPPTGTTDNGNVMAYWYQETANSSLDHTATYTYDTVNRLTNAVATGSATYNLSFNYTADGSNGQFGNMSCVQNGSTHGPCPQWTFSSSTNRISSSGFAYDAAGDLTTEVWGTSNRNYSWDAEGRLYKVVDNTGSGTSTTYTYNALGERAELITTGWQLEQLFDLAGERLGFYAAGSGNNYWDAAYVPFQGRELAEYSTGTTFAFMHTNALGSGSMSTLASGAFAGDVLFYPWGQEWLAAGGMYDTHYAGMNASLQGSGQIDYTMDEAPFRFLATNLGRWHSPDLMGGDITNPQSLNRYAYVGNNPASLTDPLGLTMPLGCGGDVDCGSGGGGWCDPEDPSCDPFPWPCDPTAPGCGIILPPGGGGGGGGGVPSGNADNGQNPPSGTPPVLPPGCEVLASGAIWCPPGSGPWNQLLGLGLLGGGAAGVILDSNQPMPQTSNGFHFASRSACYNAWSGTTLGKVDEFFSLAQMVPGFNPQGGALDAFIEDVFLMGGKYAGVTVLARFGPNALEALSITGARSAVQAGVAKAGAQFAEEIIGTSAAGAIGAVPTLIDLGARLGCAAFY